MKQEVTVKDMKKINKIVLYMFLLIAFHIFSYEYFKEIKTSGKSGYKEFLITEDIYENSRNNLGDIRILDGKGKEVPYVIETEKIWSQYNEKIISERKISERITKKDKMEFIVKFNTDNAMSDIIGNRIEVVPEKNFYSEYELLGSGNGTDWEHITSGEIYKTDEKQNLTIEFSEKRYEYYKIITPVDKGNLFNSAILKLSDSIDEKPETIETDLSYEVEKNEKDTILKIKSKFLPLKSIVIDTEDEFKRSYSVREKDSYYNEGVISRVGEKKELTINLENVPKTDTVIIEIRNGDNEPIKIKGIKGIYTPDRIVFKGEEKESYRVTFGDEKLYKPQYDLEEFSNMIKEREIVSTEKLNKVGKTSKSEKKDYTVYYNIFIGIIVLILISFMARKISKK